MALALGALHGPAELVPVSSSAHTTLIPWLLDASYLDVDAELRKALEVALHAGATAALLIAWREPLLDELRRIDRREIELVALASVPAALIGYGLGDQIELRLGRPRVIAAASIAGALGMALADREPELRSADRGDVEDALWLGLAQACALLPGISRQGVTLTAARLRHFRRRDATTLSRRLAFPVIIGATALKTWRVTRRGLAPDARSPLATALASSFLSTLLTSRLLPEPDAGRPLWPYAVYRVGLAAVILTRARPGKLDAPVHDQGHGESP